VSWPQRLSGCFDVSAGEPPLRFGGFLVFGEAGELVSLGGVPGQLASEFAGEGADDSDL